MKKKNKFIILGPNKIKGEVKISGSKNSALPILYSSLLIKEEITIKNIPNIEDINITLKLFKKIGIKIIREKNTIIINSKNINNNYFPLNLIKKIRASIWLLSPILIRCKKITLNTPGGCNLGSRPIDLHLYALKCLGVKIKYKNNIIKAKINKKLKSNIIFFKKKSIGATITSILASIFIKGKTIIKNSSKEPEIIDTINFLNKSGANIYGAGTNTIIIYGIKKLSSCIIYKILPDRIETGTYLLASAISKGKIICYNTNPNLLKCIINKLKLSGAKIKIKNDFIMLDMKNKRCKSVNIITNPYPNFPTDMQPQFTLLNSISKGNSIIIENIFKKRFSHIKELKKMGAKIKNINNKIICYGVKKIFGKTIIAKDLRCSITLILAGCIAYGKTIIKSIYHVYRGYENIIEKFKNLNIKIN